MTYGMFFVCSRKEVQHLIPSNVINLPEMQPQQWVNLVHKKLKEIERYSPLTCKVMFLGTSLFKHLKHLYFQHFIIFSILIQIQWWFGDPKMFIYPFHSREIVKWYKPWNINPKIEIIFENKKDW